MAKIDLEELNSAQTKVGHNIRYWRKQRGLTLKDIADESGYSQQAISQIERGLTDTKISALISFAAALGVSPGEFFRDTTEASRYMPITSPNVLRLVAAAEKLPAAWQQIVVMLTERICEQVTDHKGAGEKVHPVWYEQGYDFSLGPPR
jgi:transcriptional regulator with XRE-family HTH domain